MRRAADCREVPDVSASADPEHGYIIYFDGPGRRSVERRRRHRCGRPLPPWQTRAASFRESRSHTAIWSGFANPKLYALGASGTPPFNDVTSGDDDFTDTNGGPLPRDRPLRHGHGLGHPGGLVPRAGSATVRGLPFCHRVGAVERPDRRRDRRWRSADRTWRE